MGMYTEIIFGAGLDPNIPDDVLEVIKLLANGGDFDGCNFIPQHPFFKTQRTWMMNSGGSYYFPGVVSPKLWYDTIGNQWFLHFRTNIKNYDGEIEKFLDWIKPYIDQGSGESDMYAIVLYEEDSVPTIYYKWSPV